MFNSLINRNQNYLFKMSLPALRQPKTLSFLNKPKQNKIIVPDSIDAQHVILTLKDETKLVISSDAYNGVVTIEEKYKCIFCAIEIDLDMNLKQLHLSSASHRKVLGRNPFLEEFGANLIRTLNGHNFHCTICNVKLKEPFLTRHSMTDIHRENLDKALLRASTYTTK